MWRRYDAFMSRLYGPLSSLWGKVLSGTFSLLMGVLGSYVYDELTKHKGSSLALNFEDLLRPSSLRLILFFAALAYLLLGVLRFFAQRAHRRHEARKRFDLVIPASKLSPEHLDFRATAPGDPAPLDRRPFYESVYVHRHAVPYHERTEENPQIEYEEAHLIRFLEEGSSFALIGPPLDGKSRTLHEILMSLEEHVVVVPKVNEKVPSDEAFSLLLKDRHVVLLLDDLTRYADAEVDLREFWEKLGRYVSSRVVASSCRDDPELSAVRDAPKQSVRWFYDQISLKLALVEASLEEKRWLAEEIGTVQTGRDWKAFRELGQVVMEDPMSQMRGRFERLNHQSSEQRDALRALKLLAAAGVLTFTQRRLLAVMRGVFERRPAHLGDCLDALAEQSFLRRGDQDPIEPDFAYLRYVVTYSTGGKEPEEDFPRLAEVLEELQDSEGLLYLGIIQGRYLGDHEQALARFDRTTRLKPNYSEAWENKGVALAFVGRYEEALVAHDEALSLNPDRSTTWNNKGAALAFMDRYEEALEAFDEALRLQADYPEAWNGKGLALGHLDRYEEALEAFDEALRLRPDYPEAQYNKGVTFTNLGSNGQALVCFDRATRLKPNYSEAWESKGVALAFMGRFEDAVAAFDEALRLKPDFPEAHYLKGSALVLMGRQEDALEAFDEALHLRPDWPDACLNKGMVLGNLDRFEEAAEAFDEALRSKSDYPEAHYFKGLALSDLGDHAQALNCFAQATRLKPDYLDAWMKKGSTLALMGRFQEAVEAFDEALHLHPDYPYACGSKGLALRMLGRRAEAIEWLCRAWRLRGQLADDGRLVKETLGALGHNPEHCKQS
jgi:tetratricopeptide (TPR) repeat protein